MTECDSLGIEAISSLRIAIEPLLLSLKRFDGTGHREPQSKDLVFILRFTLYDGQNAAIRGLKLKLIFTFEATEQDNSRI